MTLESEDLLVGEPGTVGTLNEEERGEERQGRIHRWGPRVRALLAMGVWGVGLWLGAVPRMKAEENGLD